MIMVVLIAVLTGCKGKADKNGSMTSDDGRSYGGVIKASMGEKVSTAFFDLSVEEALEYDTYQFDDGLYEAEKGSTYLVLKVTVKNTYEKELPMSITDFVLDFDGNESKDVITGYGNADLKNADFMDNIFNLRQGESVTKYILYMVEEKDEYALCYTEYYEDQFKGNEFRIAVKPEKQNMAVTEDITDDANSPSDDTSIEAGENGESSQENTEDTSSKDASAEETSSEESDMEGSQENGDTAPEE